MNQSQIGLRVLAIAANDFAMTQKFSIATWNINSVRLRADLVVQFLQRFSPDVLCLQETKCPDDAFPFKAFAAIGYIHTAVHGQKGYHGVATLSRHPLTAIERRKFYELDDCRHLATGHSLGGRDVQIHNFYVPAGGDEADPTINPKFAHKLAFLEEMKPFAATPGSVLVGDLNIAPYEHDVWSHKQLLDVVSHTPIETDTMKALIKNGAWVDLARQHHPEPEKLYSWWSYRSADWTANDRGRRLDHIWVADDLAKVSTGIEFLREARGWDRPSDHVPVIASFET
jgi:exodeoxyribonuclease III